MPQPAAAHALAELGQILAKSAQRANSYGAFLFGPVQTPGQDVKLVVTLYELDLDLRMSRALRSNPL